MEEENTPVEETEVIEETQELEATETETQDELTPEQSETEEVDSQKEQNQLNYERRKRIQAEKERQLAIQENERLRQQAPVSPNQYTQQQHVGDPNEPNLDRYLEEGKTAEQWSRDHHGYLNQQAKVQEQSKKVAQTYEQQLAEYAQKNPAIYDYENDVSRLVTPEVAQAIVRSPKSAELVEKIALDVSLARQLNGLDIHGISRKLIELEGVTKKPSISSAPDTIKTPKKKTVSSGVDKNSMTPREYREYMNGLGL